jgi:hypothetical protein
MSTEVWILESLRDTDRKTGRALREAILDRDPLSKRCIEVQLRNPASRSEFFEALKEVLASANAGRFPILHIEAHGNPDGIRLTNGEDIEWEDLASSFVEINQRLRGGLIITVAACSGAHMARTAFHSIRSPFFALIGPGEKIKGSELLNDYTEFYYEFDKTRSLTKAGWALNAFKLSKGTYFSTTAMHTFKEQHKHRFSEVISPKELDERIEKFVVKLVRSDPSTDPDQARQLARDVIFNPEVFVRKAWERFMYLDENPENFKLFPCPFENAQA